MAQTKRLALAVGIGLLLCVRATGELSVSYPIDYAALKSELIVEGSRNSDKTVVVTRVYFGSAKIGDELPVDWLTDHLPSIAYERVSWGRNETDKGTPTKGETAMLFLVRDEHQAAYEPFDGGPGVKWILNKKVYGYAQGRYPGPYFLLPDSRNPTLEQLRLAVANGLKKRQGFEEVLLERSPDARAKRLSRYLQPTEPYHYFRESVRALETLGHAGALVFQRELVRPEQQRHRRDLIISIGGTNDKESIPFLMSIVDSAKSTLVGTRGVFDRSKASEEERRAMSDWEVAVYAASLIGDARALAHFREAAVWGAKHGVRGLLEPAVRGMQKNPVKANLPTFQVIFASLPREANGFGNTPAYWTLLSLNEHQFRDAVPLLASQLDHPNEYHQRTAHRGLKELVGTDLGKKKEAWLEWHSLSHKP